MEIKSGSNTLLKDIAYEKIKLGIIEDLYQPGYFLSEKKLVEELEMSKTPIKSAIDRLESEGFVTVSSKRGIIIKDLSIDRINDIYNLRIALETFNCKQIYHRITSNELEEIKTNLNKMADTVNELNVKQFAQVDHEFHRIISHIAGNQEIQHILLNYHDHLYRITLRHLNKEPKRMHKFYEDHIVMYDQLKNHDQECIESMRKHLDESKQLLFR
ncbi:GntR family transcriptional regulator [Natribacillus halophilus]|uniref:DNA-binding transcriptional regulator, GntR family n=1 Tax=Natribacillus halophilus TaxID=549003 RepID=A0A1G8SLH2_9BACI|nr:GntR family transcriptional regulator [Natribacillus halophilus]SDJ30089.1 DNA-binding transcriptional regulator, GntR family [Natribacillus halophilus]